ncbi:TPA: hypothetical protein N0F65_010639 [Lagenidium giganteum]|uniref:Uncharacterized protein n=1 Tax=Lagenidium giganteum TaxID=4803 RepID=A0AAV2Z996_9STRA|nr:TPA: hypothetical protein N0F65_010639 [Lagenidium giganteum]
MKYTKALSDKLFSNKRTAVSIKAAEKYQHIHEVNLLDLSTSENRARFCGIFESPELPVRTPK